jgi:hypothetical protein
MHDPVSCRGTVTPFGLAFVSHIVLCNYCEPSALHIAYSEEGNLRVIGVPAMIT